MKRIPWCILVLVAAITPFFSRATTTVDPLQLPPLTELVTDRSNVLDASSIDTLNEQARALQTGTTAEIAAVLFPHRQGNELFDIGLRLFRTSGIGQKNTNNGMLLLIATDEKKLRIMVGYGLEGAFPDIRVRTLIEHELRPLVNAGQWATAIDVYQRRIAAQLETEGAHTPNTTDYTLTMRDILFFLLRAGATRASIRSLQHHKYTKKHPVMQFGPLIPFLGLFCLFLLTAPGVLGAFMGYFVGVIIGSLSVWPVYGWPWYQPRWGWRSGGSSGGWFGGFGGGSTGGGGAWD